MGIGPAGVDDFVGLGEERLERFGEVGVPVADFAQGERFRVHIPLGGELQLDGMTRGGEEGDGVAGARRFSHGSLFLLEGVAVPGAFGVAIVGSGAGAEEEEKRGQHGQAEQTALDHPEPGLAINWSEDHPGRADVETIG